MMTNTENEGLVLLFSIAADPSRAARLHSTACPMVNTSKGRRGRVTAIRDNIDANCRDLEERGFPVKRCKCCK